MRKLSEGQTDRQKDESDFIECCPTKVDRPKIEYQNFYTSTHFFFWDICTWKNLKVVEMLFINTKITHMWRRWGTPQNFFWVFTDELEKQIIIFCPFSPLTTQKKDLEILLLYTGVPLTTFRWCMVPEILSKMDRIFCHFGPFSALLSP